jgi:ATP:ADP antiporter, AAA family
VLEPPPHRDRTSWRGARLVFRSRYLLAILGIATAYELTSAILDFQFTATVAHYLTGDAIGRHFSRVYLITNVVALAVQLLVTSLVLARASMLVALSVTPLVMLAASGAFVAVPALWLGSLLNTADNAFGYSLNQSARQTLYTPTSRIEKYEARAFIDIFVLRLAKVVGIGATLLVTSAFATSFGAVRWLSLVAVAVLLGWLVAAAYAGRRFEQLTGARGRDARAPRG